MIHNLIGGKVEKNNNIFYNNVNLAVLFYCGIELSCQENDYF